MDSQQQKQKFDWLPAQMPKVAALIKARRELEGAAHVNECWRRGVLLGEPGWFFAQEGALAVGTPDPGWDWRKWKELDGIRDVTGVAVLIMKTKEEQHG